MEKTLLINQRDDFGTARTIVIIECGGITGGEGAQSVPQMIVVQPALSPQIHKADSGVMRQRAAHSPILRLLRQETIPQTRVEVVRVLLCGREMRLRVVLGEPEFAMQRGRIHRRGGGSRSARLSISIGRR